MKKMFKKGFTLVEVLVAILILALVIAGGISAVTAGLRTAYTAKNQVIAYYLSQDAFEYLRGMRDEAIANSNQTNAAQKWTDFVSRFNQCITTQTGGTPPLCSIDTTRSYPATIQPCSTPCPLKFNDTYNTLTGATTPTNIQRYISARPLTNNGVQNELEITLTVSWREITGTKTATFINSLYDWR